MRKKGKRIRRIILILVIIFVLYIWLDDDYDYSDVSCLNGPLGSAGECEGETLVITILADDDYTSWDLTNATDRQTFDDAVEFTRMAGDYISENAKEYGIEADFINGDDNSDLVYYMTYTGDATDIDAYDEDADEDIDSEFYTWINENIEPDLPDLMSEYNADNVIFLALINSPWDCETVSCTRTWYEGAPYPYEICYMFMHSEDIEETPSAFAHEMLHTFGAPDLYTTDEEYAITQDYVDYLDSTWSNELMYTTYDSETWEPHYSYISNDITEITAYYIGWIDSSEDVDEWGLGESQHLYIDEEDY